MTDSIPPERDTLDGDVIDANALAVLNRSEIDISIATAHKFPRTVTKAIQEAKSLATLDQPTAASMFYSLPRKEQGGGTKMLQGPSVRLAEVFACCWGNLRIDARIIQETDTFIVAQGVCHDLEKNVASRTEVRRRITYSSRNGRPGGKYSDDMIIVTANAALAIARRNAVYQVVPRVYVEQVLTASMAVAAGDAATLVERREKLVGWIVRVHRVSEARVLAAVDRLAVGDIDLDDLLQLNGLCTSIKEGTIKVDDAFPQPADRNPPVDGSVVTTSKAADITDKINNPAGPATPSVAQTPPPPASTKATAAAKQKPAAAVSPAVDPLVAAQQAAAARSDTAAAASASPEPETPPADPAPDASATEDAPELQDEPDGGSGEPEETPGETVPLSLEEEQGPGQPEPEAATPPAAKPLVASATMSDNQLVSYIVTKRPEGMDLIGATVLVEKRLKVWLPSPGKWEKLNPQKRMEVITKVDAGTFPWNL